MYNYEDAGKMTKEAMDNALKSFAAMTKGFQQITAETADFTKRSYENQTAMVEKLFQAKTLDKSIEVQSEFAKSAYESWVAQMTKIGDLYADIAKETYKPFEQVATAASTAAVKTAKEATTAAEKKVAAAAN
ncbi:phasin family protein [Jiella sp. MQZ9-1]|uniref:Phasin family protein n=1 Tax=Jiella flava TaxID=2816857 RepID=A0A939FWN5_9HYPH|nr:phasin family protein [Jiella flava]MBO0662229.1 phasin family protein [Jiella flava]MCD2470940.1 phasin family protein [Jiella flava]